MEKATVGKVIIYVIQENKLLVFRHADHSFEEVGLQLPAGTIEKDELPEDAALRELREETKKDCFEIISKLGMAEYDISPYRNEVQKRHFFQLRLPMYYNPAKDLSFGRLFQKNTSINYLFNTSILFRGVI